MKAIYFILILMILLPFTSLARDVKNTRIDIRKYKTELNLTTQQMSQLNTIYSNLAAKTKLAAPQVTHEQRMKMRIETRKQFRSDISKVLTKEQGIKLKGIMEANKAKK
jgi:hypothetical protein